MNAETKNPQQADSISVEELSNAMNFIGQNLLSALNQTVDKLPPQLRNRKVVYNALSAFMANVIYKQHPKDQESCQQMLNELTKLIGVQLNSISAQSVNE